MGDLSTLSWSSLGNFLASGDGTPRIVKQYKIISAKKKTYKLKVTCS